MQISNREKQIIESLLKNPHSFLSMQYIAQTLGVSSRTVHRELKYVEASLDAFHLSLERVPRKGIRIQGDDNAIEALVEVLAQQKIQDFSIEERKVIIIYALIKAKEPLKIYNLANEVGISINTLNKELDALAIELARYNLKLKKKRGEGIMLEGAEVYRRQFLADTMLQKLNATSMYSVIEDHFVYQTLNDTNLNNLVDMTQIFNVERMLMDALSELPYVLTETAYLTLTLHIVLAIERIKNAERVSIDANITDSLKDTEEFTVAHNLTTQLSEVYQVPFDFEETIFITMHLRGAKRKADESETTSDINTDTKALIQAVEKYAQMKFSDNETLFNGVKLHLVPALNRISGGIETFNPLTEMIKSDYPTIYNAVKFGLSEVFPKLNFPDGEIAFIALHFGSISRPAVLKHVLVVCTSGIGTSRILSSKIEANFSNVVVKQQASVSDLKHIDLEQFDYIVSTVAIDIKRPYSVVNPLLPESDRLLLAQYFEASNEAQSRYTQDATHVDYDEFMQFSLEGHALIQSISVCEMTDNNYIDFIADYLSEHDALNDVAHFKSALNYRNHLQGFLMTGTDIAIPHLVHESIKRPAIVMVRAQNGVELKDMDGNMNTAHYLAHMYLPEETTARPLVSELSLCIMDYIETPSTLFNDDTFVVDYMKQALMNLITKKLTNTE
ncbi:BglG family transcription antiterminator [Macrococcus capreoli]|uniref:BglG family transcription antiterminator n=1 Tax=Macrococcus capreoli TaxID=2982690 RepID=UPI0021D5F14C|nr:BglG family transcription antiterminator [Macrococcus sp. TMW 2.2395]MCU7558603.1 BglG family transcription antiterminator [Macrococcus sp. TMW 2.2395]